MELPLLLQPPIVVRLGGAGVAMGALPGYRGPTSAPAARGTTARPLLVAAHGPTGVVPSSTQKKTPATTPSSSHAPQAKKFGTTSTPTSKPSSFAGPGLPSGSGGSSSTPADVGQSVGSETSVVTQAPTPAPSTPSWASSGASAATGGGGSTSSPLPSQGDGGGGGGGDASDAGEPVQTYAAEPKAGTTLKQAESAAGAPTLMQRWDALPTITKVLVVGTVGVLAIGLGIGPHLIAGRQ